jgi:hypothetical protein
VIQKTPLVPVIVLNCQILQIVLVFLIRWILVIQKTLLVPETVLNCQIVLVFLIR